MKNKLTTCMRKREKVISNQVHLITTFRQRMYETQRSMDQYIVTVEKYCELQMKIGLVH